MMSNLEHLTIHILIVDLGPHNPSIWTSQSGLRVYPKKKTSFRKTYHSEL